MRFLQKTARRNRYCRLVNVQGLESNNHWRAVGWVQMFRRQGSTKALEDHWLFLLLQAVSCRHKYSCCPNMAAAGCHRKDA